MQGHPAEVPVQQSPCDNLGEDVRRVAVAGHLVQREAAGAEPLLHPELADRQVADSPDAGSATDADGGGRVSMDAELQRDAQPKVAIKTINNL